MSKIKIRRAQKLSKIGDCYGSFAAMLDGVPATVVIDAMWSVAGASKAIADREACSNGFVWDARSCRARNLAA